MPGEELINCRYALLLHLIRRWLAILKIKLRNDLLGGAGRGRPERRRGAVGLATADPAGPPREPRRPRGERRHGGVPL
uniref:Calcium-binding EF hand family protein n=1 Tax=Arundo donax TaxID=35708 RepID=A0A0A9E117_ARUDO